MAMLDRQTIRRRSYSERPRSNIGLDEALESLLAFCLIAAQNGGSSFELHRLVQLSTKKWLELQGIALMAGKGFGING